MSTAKSVWDGTKETKVLLLNMGATVVVANELKGRAYEALPLWVKLKLRKMASGEVRHETKT